MSAPPPPRHWPQRRRHGLRALALTSVAAVALAGCAAPASVEPGPHASDPMCAEVLRSSPEELQGTERRGTTSQSTRAWGDPAIELRCGVVVPGPTTVPCLTIADDAGVAVDWLIPELDDGETLTVTTYGRSPAVEVVLPPWAQADHGAILLALAPAVTQIPQTRECL